MSASDTPKYKNRKKIFLLVLIYLFRKSSRIRHTPKTTRAYESSDGGTPSPARFRSKRNCNNETHEKYKRKDNFDGLLKCFF